MGKTEEKKEKERKKEKKKKDKLSDGLFIIITGKRIEITMQSDLPLPVEISSDGSNLSLFQGP